MSLIQEALKRKSQETANTPVRQQPVEVLLPVKPKPPVVQQPVEESVKSPQTITVALIVLMIVLLFMTVTGLAFYLIHVSVKAQAVKSTKAEPPAVSTPSKVDVPAEQPPANTTVAQAEQTEEISEKTETTPDHWPKLSISGIVYSETRKAVLLNGKLLTAGQQLGQVKVLDVRPSEITVEYSNETRVISLY